MKSDNFWQELNLPILGVSPMDGVTDVAFRSMIAKKSTPSVIFTEFVPVEGLLAGARALLASFLSVTGTNIPQIAQIYGTNLEGFYLATLVVCELGFAGVDINMGCPAKSVTARGAGAGLIRTPDLAREIIQTVRRATYDYCDNPGILSQKTPSGLIDTIKQMKEENAKHGIFPKTTPIPVSLKTRIGYDKPEVEDWINQVLGEKPDNISLHGRTLKQGYTGHADKEAIKTAGKIIAKFNSDHATKITFLANGDFRSLEDAVEFCQNPGVSGVLFGRVLEGNPWFFAGHHPSVKERMQASLEHCRLFLQYLPDYDFRSLRKHLMWYAKDFPSSASVRVKFAGVRDLSQVEVIVDEVLTSGVV